METRLIAANPAEVETECLVAIALDHGTKEKSEPRLTAKDSALEKTPAAVSLCFSAMPTIFLTPAARSSGVILAVAAKWRDGIFEARALLLEASSASGMGSRSGSGCCNFARFSADRTTCRKLSSSNLLVEARAVRPPKTLRTETA